MLPRSQIKPLPLAVSLLPILALCATVTAAFAADPSPLTLRDAVQIALEKNPDLLKAGNQLEAGKSTLAQSRAEYLPAVNLSVSSTRLFDKSYNPVTGNSSPESSTSLNSSVSANVNLFKGFGDETNIAKLSSSVRAADAGRERLRQSITLQISAGFFEVASGRELVRVAEENLEAQKGQLTVVQGFFDAGRRALADVYQQQASVAQAEFDLITAQNALAVSRLNLFRLMGLPLDAAYDIAPPSDSLLAGPDLSDNPEALDVENSRPDLIQQQAQLDAAFLQIRYAEAGYYPVVSLNGQLGSGYGSRAKPSFGDQFGDINQSASFGLSLTLPLYDKGRTSLAVQQAKLQYESDRLTLANLKTQAALDIQQARLNLEAARKQLSASEAQVTFSKQALEATQERYRVGAATIIEVTQARAGLVQATGNRIKTAYKLIQARIALGFASGDINRELAKF